MAKRYGSFTPARRAALRKAQLASAARRRGQHRRSTAKRYARRAAIGVGVVGTIAGAGYGYHKASGSSVIRSARTPTTINHISGKPVGRTGFHRTGQTVGFTSRTAKGDKTILYAHGVKRRNVLGQGVRGHPSNPVDIGKYKPTRGDFARMKKHNVPVKGTEQYAREAMVYPHGPTAYLSRKIETGEAIRRTRSYVQATEARGKKVTVAHHTAASNFYANQPRYTGGTVKPLRRLTRRKARRVYKTRNSISTTLPVIGSRKRAM